MIPVFEPVYGEDEIAAVAAAMRRGEISGSFGTAIPEFESRFAAWCGVKHGIAVTSGSTALHMAVTAAGIGPGDEVLVSACTNIATALAVVHNGAFPVPVDSEETTWNMDLDLVEGLITPRTKAIIPVHIYGHPVDMDRLMEIARKHRLTVIEDCAESHGATCRGRMTGGFGNMGCFSFYANKVITTGEGGMVVTSDDALAERLKLLRNLAFTTPRFRHELAGFNFRMTGMQAAMGLVQLSKIDAIIKDKRRVARLYNAHIAGIQAIRTPAELPWAKNVYWMYGIVVRRGGTVTRDALANRLKNEGIDSRTFFCPMGAQPCLTARAGFRKVPTPVADMLWECGLYLPSTHTLDERTIMTVSDAVRRALS
jgi:perosamine synthetase